MPYRIAGKIRKAVSGIVAPRIIALGAAYKPNTDDLRESPALVVVESLREDGYDVQHFDPLFESMRCPSLLEAARGADMLAILVPHEALLAELERDRAAIEQAMRTPIIQRYQ